MRVTKGLLSSAAAISALGGGGLLATGAIAIAGSVGKHRQLQQEPPTVYVGYAYNVGGFKFKHPSPWKGGTGVIFEACNYFQPDRCPTFKSGADRYDSGAVRIVNSSDASMAVTNVSVTVGSCTFNPWPNLNVTVPVGEQLILAQTEGPRPCTDRGKYNFDTSETSKSCTTNDGEIPLVNMTVNGDAFTFSDNHQVLNTGGVDPGGISCGARNETENWKSASPS